MVFDAAPTMKTCDVLHATEVYAEVVSILIVQLRLRMHMGDVHDGEARGVCANVLAFVERLVDVQRTSALAVTVADGKGAERTDADRDVVLERLVHDEEFVAAQAARWCDPRG